MAFAPISTWTTTPCYWNANGRSSTAIADGIAIPHGKNDLPEEVLAAVRTSTEGLDFDSVDGRPTKLFLPSGLATGPPVASSALVGAHRGLLKNEAFRGKLLAATSAEENSWGLARGRSEKLGTREPV